MNEQEHFRNSFIRRGGKIFPFGLIKILSNGVKDPPADDYLGLGFWSEKLLPFGGDKYYAKIMGDKVGILTRQADVLVETIDCSDFECATEIYTVEVKDKGFLKPVGFFGARRWTADRLKSGVIRRKIAFSGDEQDKNHPSAQVSEDFIGFELVFLGLSDNNLDLKDRCLVFTEEGKPVELILNYPKKA